MTRTGKIVGQIACLLMTAWTFHAALGRIVVEPTRTELSGAPGARLEGCLTAENASDSNLLISVSFQDLTPNAYLYDEDDMDWIDIETGTNQVAAGKSLSVPYKIRIPTNYPGELFGRIAFAYMSKPVDASRPAAIGIRTKLSFPLYVRIEGSEDYRADIVSLNLTATNPPAVECLIHHQGNVHLTSTGECVVVSLGKNREVARFPINQRRFVLFPGATNLVAGRTSTRLRPGDYSFTVSLPFPDEQHILRKEFPVTIPNPESPSKGTTP